MSEELQTQNKLVGFKQSIKAVESGKAAKVFLAKDADPQMQKSVEQSCGKANVPVEFVQSMAELGKSCGINIGAAVATILRD